MVDYLHSGEVRVEIRVVAIVLIQKRRVCVLHGRPVSISKPDVNAAQPSDFPALRATDRIDTLPNVLAMIRLTATLEDARDRMCVRLLVSDERLTNLADLVSKKPPRNQDFRSSSRYRS